MSMARKVAERNRWLGIWFRYVDSYMDEGYPIFKQQNLHHIWSEFMDTYPEAGRYITRRQGMMALKSYQFNITKTGRMGHGLPIKYATAFLGIGLLLNLSMKNTKPD